jgi:hypothetical protein
MPEGSAARTKGKKWGVGGFGKTRGDTVRMETRGGAVSATEASASAPSGGVETLGMLPRMTHDDEGGGEEGEAMCGWSWVGLARKKSRALGWPVAWCGRRRRGP